MSTIVTLNPIRTYFSFMSITDIKEILVQLTWTACYDNLFELIKFISNLENNQHYFVASRFQNTHDMATLHEIHISDLRLPQLIY